MKFARDFSGVRSGDIYPTAFAPGDECPPELAGAALDAGALEPDPGDLVDDRKRKVRP